MDQWKVKIGLENIKLRQALETVSAPLADPRLMRSHQKEVRDFVGRALRNEKERQFDDVFITDHQPR